jgi:predicted ArsR family transcriptional regulator
MSLAEITGIPRSTVIRKLKSLIKKDLLQINEKNLIIVNMRGKSFKVFQRLQYQNIISLSNFISRTFNQLKITN